jgi:hypothetical protein
MRAMNPVLDTATRPRVPANVVLAALRWVVWVLWCSRRERARRFLALLLPAEDSAIWEYGRRQKAPLSSGEVDTEASAARHDLIRSWNEERKQEM